jgi:hypothetical protein
LREFIDEAKKKTIHEFTGESAERMMQTGWEDFDPKEYIQTDK